MYSFSLIKVNAAKTVLKIQIINSLSATSLISNLKKYIGASFEIKSVLVHCGGGGSF